jgi:hypothetical protein
MNTNFANIVKQIIAEHGETVLDNPQRVKAFFSDLAKDEPKPLRLAFGRCIEAGAYPALKNAPDAQARREVKAALAQRVHDDEGLDIVFCGGGAFDVLETALFGEVKNRAYCKQCGKEIQPEWALCPFCGAQTSVISTAPQSASPSWEMPPQRASSYQTQQPQQEAQLPQPVARKRSKLLLVVIILILLFYLFLGL